MRRFTRLLIYFTASVFLLTGCRDKEMEEHYGRPDWLPSPIYQQLESKGNFKSFLACIDKAGYKTTLSGAGYFTVFAPNDAAFDAFFTDNKLSGVDAIDGDMARKIVTYALVYNAFQKEKLTDFQSNLGWQPLSAFKRRTAYYEGVYDENNLGGVPLKVISANRNGDYVVGDNNNKHIPYFIDTYLTKHNLTAADYNAFYPASTYNGFNVAEASVVNFDIRAENGYIHEVDKVILPLPSIESYLKGKSDYSVFYDLMRKYPSALPLIQYSINAQVTSRYRVTTGSDKDVFVKLYSPLLGFSPNNENFLVQSDNDGQTDGWTLMAPNNDAVNAYMVKLLEHYQVVEALPPAIVHDFINAHMWQTTVWPSKFSSTFSALGEPARFDKTDISESKMLSNGVFYGTTKAQDADVFRSVYGQAYLNPEYSLMTSFINRELKSTIISPNVKFTLFLVKDADLKTAGYDTDPLTGAWRYNGTTSLGTENWSRLINMHVLITNKNELNDFSSSEGIIETFGNEYIKYKDNTVRGAGNIEEGTLATVTASKPAYNGMVHYLNRPIEYPDNDPAKGVAAYIRELADAGEPYQKFFQYLAASKLVPADFATTNNINGVSSGVFYTFFIPNDAAITAAIAATLLPANPLSTNDADREKVANFIQYHIMPQFSVINDNKVEGSYETLYKPLNGDKPPSITLLFNAGTGVLTITDAKNRTANIVKTSIGTNLLGNRVVFHEIDNYLRN